jgi:hypothetical protein
MEYNQFFLFLLAMMASWFENFWRWRGHFQSLKAIARNAMGFDITGREVSRLRRGKEKEEFHNERFAQAKKSQAKALKVSEHRMHHVIRNGNSQHYRPRGYSNQSHED